MKKIAYAFLASLLLLPSFTLAADPPATPSPTNTSIYSSGLNTGANAAYDNALPNADLLGVITLLIKAVLSLLGVVFLVLIIYAGILWLTAAGNEDRVKKAQGILKNAVIGIFIAMAAYAISYFILTNISNSITGSSVYTP